MTLPSQSPGVTSAGDMKILRPNQTGTVLIESIDCAAIVTRDLSDNERSTQTVESYALAYMSGASMPPVEVFLVDGRMVLVDGDHRVKARLALREMGVVAHCVGAGSMSDALLYALKQTNRSHGLRLSPADCRHRVLQALDSGMWDGASANALASDLGVAQRTAAKYMGEWEAARGVAVPEVRTDTKGRKQPTRKPRRVEVRPPVETPDDVCSANVPSTPEPAIVGDEPLPFEREHGATVPTTATPMPSYPALASLAERLRNVRLAARREIPECLTGVRQRVETSVRAAEVALQQAEPVVCEKCGGEGCASCGAQGWTSRLVAAR